MLVWAARAQAALWCSGRIWRTRTSCRMAHGTIVMLLEYGIKAPMSVTLWGWGYGTKIQVVVVIEMMIARVFRHDDRLSGRHVAWRWNVLRIVFCHTTITWTHASYTVFTEMMTVERGVEEWLAINMPPMPSYWRPTNFRNSLPRTSQSITALGALSLSLQLAPRTSHRLISYSKSASATRLVLLFAHTFEPNTSSQTTNFMACHNGLSAPTNRGKSDAFLLDFCASCASTGICSSLSFTATHRKHCSGVVLMHCASDTSLNRRQPAHTRLLYFGPRYMIRTPSVLYLVNCSGAETSPARPATLTRLSTSDNNTSPFNLRCIIWNELTSSAEGSVKNIARWCASSKNRIIVDLAAAIESVPKLT